MIFNKSYKITPNFFSRIKSDYLININDRWFVYEHNKYSGSHTLELLQVLSHTNTEPYIFAFDNGCILVIKHNKITYGSFIQYPAEEKEPKPESIEQIKKIYNSLDSFQKI